MTRDHYSGIPKRRVVRVDADGNYEATQLGAPDIEIKGTTSLSSGVATVSGSEITANSFVLISPHISGPSDVAWQAHDGYVTLSGTGDGVVAYNIKV